MFGSLWLAPLIQIGMTLIQVALMRRLKLRDWPDVHPHLLRSLELNHRGEVCQVSETLPPRATGIGDAYRVRQ